MSRAKQPQLKANLLLGLLGAAALAGLGLPVSAGAALRPFESSRLVTVGALARIPRGDRSLGPLPSSRTLSLGFALSPRNPSSLAAYATDVSIPGDALFHRYLTPVEFAARFAPSQTTVRRLERDLQAEGFRIGAVPADRLVVPVRASVGVIERALRTHLVAYHLPDGEIGWSTTSAPQMSKVDGSGVSEVIGLDNLVTAHTSLQQPRALSRSGTEKVSPKKDRTGAPTACTAASEAAQSGSGWTQDEIAKAYGLSDLFSKGDLAAGQTVALFELEPFMSSDVATFDRCFFGSSHTKNISVEPIDGFDLSGPGTGEATLDVENVSALAPDAHIVVYEAPNTTFGTLDEYAAIVSQDRANIVSTSWGECESALATGAPGATQLENSLFEEAAAQGQTFFAAAGDNGSDDCASTPFTSNVAVAPYLSVDDPGAQPFVVSVGGTSLTSDRQPLAPKAETVWNDGAQSGGGGGGISESWPLPIWQADSGVPGVATSGNREVPDVSASADQLRGVTVYSSSFAPTPTGELSPVASDGPSGAWTTIGGTSSATPIWAAIAAEIAASATAGTSCGGLPLTAGGPDLGFIAPELYSVAATHYAASFNNIVSGNNDVFGLGFGYRATPGFNLASGLGSPIVTNRGAPGLATYLCADATGAAVASYQRPIVTGISPSFGPVDGGGALTVDLRSPLPTGVSVHAQVGAAVATVLSVSDSSVVVTVPSSPLTASAASLAGAGPAAVTLTISGAAGTVSSGPSAAATYDYVNESGGIAPTVTGVGPSAGNAAGGETVTVYGSGFESGNDTVAFGGVDAPAVDVDSDYELTATVPPESAATSCATGAGFDPSDACQVEVVVTNSSGTSPTVPILPALSGPIVFNPQGVVEPTPETEVAAVPTEFDYSPTPTITSITPNPADESGATPVTISGSGFNLNTFDWVNFGPKSSVQSEQVGISYLSGSTIKLDPPPAAIGGLSTLVGGVSVETGGGVSNVVHFGYAGVPSVRSISRRAGPATGGTRIKITGRNLTGTTSIDFISSSPSETFSLSTSSDIVRRTARTITVVAPASFPGSVDVEPCTPTGCSRANPARDGFVFFSVSPPSITAVRPNHALVGNDTVVVIDGSNLAGALRVWFGSRETTSFVRPNGFPLDDPTTIAVVAPSAPRGSTVRIRVVTRVGKTPVSGRASFTYE